jgi:iron complex outermembrane recepter protein
MNKKLILLGLLGLFFNLSLAAQKIILSGILTDAETKEPLVGAVIQIGSNGTTTGIDGDYSFEVRKGRQEVVVTYVGYEEKKQILDITEDTKLNIELVTSNVMKEVVVSADIAIDRRTPVAFNNISTTKLQEELASQDLPMVLNSIPGSYATQAGGGDGDARISIRGFSQRNIAVMLDGIPVNDMENGQVFWSNWFGLNSVTKTMQVQRGLGSSKISIPSVGGTINILTKGIEADFGVKVKQEIGTGGYYQTSVGITSGRLKNNFGVSAAFSYKTNEGVVEQLYSKAYFYFLRIDKEFGKHHLTLSGFGGPQEHGQRPFTQPIAFTSTDFARKLGVPDSAIAKLSAGRVNKGNAFNDSWNTVDGKVVNTRINYYHKPQFSLRHSYEITPRLYLSNVAYLSLGNGGGTSLEQSVPTDSTQRPNLQLASTFNKSPLNSSATSIRANVNNHFWYGLLSTARYDISKYMKFTGGIDLRYYRGEHYRKVYDMLGGSRFLGNQNARIDNLRTPLVVGDKYNYNYDGFVRWSGLFGTWEYSQKKWSAFLNLSGALSSYKLEDFLYAKNIDIDGKKVYTQFVTRLSDVPLKVAIDKTKKVMYTVENTSQVMRDYAKTNDLTIDSTSAQNQIIDWITRPTATIKAGFSYNLSARSTVFLNAGYLSKATRYNNTINSRGITNNKLGIIEYKTFSNYENEIIAATEVGYQFRSKSFAFNVNGYYTSWKNKPVDAAVLVNEDPLDPQSDRIPVGISGIGARHLGLEFDAAINLHRKLKMEAIASIGDWIWNSKGTLTNPITFDETTFDPTGVHVSDAAQVQLGAMLRYEPIKRGYVSIRYTYFDKNYANFNPENLTGVNVRRESWKMPAYFLADLNAGYSWSVKKINFDFRFNLLNMFDNLYIADARNNDDIATTFAGFNAQSASVFFGLPRRLMFTLEIGFK